MKSWPEYKIRVSRMRGVSQDKNANSNATLFHSLHLSDFAFDLFYRFGAFQIWEQSGTLMRNLSPFVKDSKQLSASFPHLGMLRNTCAEAFAAGK